MTGTPSLVAVPDTAVAAAATELLTATSPPALVNHCLRTFQFGAALGVRDELDVDLEMLYIGSALHDLGLTGRFDGPEPFEAEGAQAAYGYLVKAGYPA